MPRRKVSPQAGSKALKSWLSWSDNDEEPLPRATVNGAVWFTLEEFAQAHPGHACEIRVPPFAVVQCLAGPRHTRGTPPNVVECDAPTWLALATGRLDWSSAREQGRLSASGERSDLSRLLPLRVASEEL